MVNYHNIITKLRPHNKNGGGVALYISEKYDYKINEKICDLKLTNVEAVAANIKINNTNLTLMSIYKNVSKIMKE